MGIVKLSILFLMVFCVGYQDAKDFQIGTSVTSHLFHWHTISLQGIPFQVRTQRLVYSGIEIISAITAVDWDQGNSSAWVVAGGVGSYYAEVKMQSQMGDGLHYQLQVFV